MKKKYLKKVVAIIAIVALTVSFVACGKKQTIVGTWEQTGSESKDEYVFNEDNTGTYTQSMLSPISFTYATEGDKVTISMTILNQKDVKSYNYKLDNNKLTMTIDGNDVTFEKK